MMIVPRFKHKQTRMWPT